MSGNHSYKSYNAGYFWKEEGRNVMCWERGTYGGLIGLGGKVLFLTSVVGTGVVTTE